MNETDLALDPALGGIRTEYSEGTPRISFALVDGDGDVVRSYDAQRVYYSASTVKIGVLVAALRRVQNGLWSLDREFTITHEFESAASGAGRFVMEREETDEGLGTPGDIVDLARLLDRMVTVSANCATNILFDAVGADEVAKSFEDAGAPDSGMDRLYSDEAALREGITNRATALGLARFMSSLVRGDLLDAERTAYATDLLRAQQHLEIGSVVNRVSAVDGVEIDWGSKSGSVEGIEHDVAFVRRGGSTQSLAVCTSGFGEHQGRAVIHAVAAALLDARL